MNHHRATERIIHAMLHQRPVIRYGVPVRMVRTGRRAYAIVTDKGAPLGAPSNADLRAVLDWLKAEYRIGDAA